MKKDTLVLVLIALVPLLLGSIAFIFTYLWRPPDLIAIALNLSGLISVLSGVVVGGYLASKHYLSERWRIALIYIVLIIIFSIIIDNIIFEYWRCRNPYSGVRILVDCGFGIPQNLYIFSSLLMFWCISILMGWVPVSILSYVRRKYKERKIPSTAQENQSKSQ